MVYDGKMWIMGGTTGALQPNNAVWYAADAETWTEATAAAPWTARHNHTSVVFDGKMWVIGGIEGIGGDLRNDVWWGSPYQPSGTYISSNHGTGIVDTRITRVSWNADVPSGSNLTVEVAAGNSPNPSNWEPVTNPDTSISVAGGFIRYRVTFNGTGLNDYPRFEDITIEYTAPATNGASCG